MILPNDKLDNCSVIASVVLNDTDYDWDLWVALLLAPEAPYYRLVEVTTESGTATVRTLSVVDKFPNIVPAVEAYVNNGGDY